MVGEDASDARLLRLRCDETREVPPAEAIKDNSGLNMYLYHGAACCKERENQG